MIELLILIVLAVIFIIWGPTSIPVHIVKKEEEVPVDYETETS